MSIAYYLNRWLAPCRCGIAGFATAVVIVGASAVSMAMHPDYCLLRQYISQLAMRDNPGHWVFNVGLLLGGVLMVPFAWGLRSLVHNAHGGRAALLGMACGAAMVLVGLFPLTWPWPWWSWPA